MRKFLMMAAVVGLALLVATPSMALDFKFGAEYRVRFYTFVNAVDGGAGTSGPVSTFGDGAVTAKEVVRFALRGLMPNFRAVALMGVAAVS